MLLLEAPIRNQNFKARPAIFVVLSALVEAALCSRRLFVRQPRFRATNSSNFTEAIGQKRIWKGLDVRCTRPQQSIGQERVWKRLLEVWRSRPQRGGVRTVGPHAERSVIKIGVTSHTIRRYLLHRCTFTLRLRDDI
jgi:hypothetical protein